MPPKFIMFVGVPYSGKTHYKNTNQQFKNADFTYLSFDSKIHQIAQALGKDYNQHFKDLFPEAEKQVKAEFMEALDKKLNIILDMTHLTKTSRARKLSSVSKDYEKICFVFPVPTSEQFTERRLSRPEQVVPMSVIQSMIDMYEAPTLKEGFDKVVFLESDVVLRKGE